MKKKLIDKKWIWFGILGVLAGFYFGVESGSSSLMVRGIVGVVMGLLAVWLVGGFFK